MSVILAVEYMSTLYTGRKYVCRKKYVRWRNVRRKDVPVPVGDAKETSASSILIIWSLFLRHFIWKKTLFMDLPTV